MGAGLAVQLIAPRFYFYSGLATGVLSGALPPDANRIDIAAFAERHGVAFIDGEMSGINGHRVRLRDGRSVAFDLLSLSCGSAVDHDISGEVWPVKPLANLTWLRTELEERLARGKTPTIMVAGSGVTGTEVAASLAGLGERHGTRLPITLVGPPQQGMGWHSLYRTLEQRGVVRLPDRRVQARTDRVRLDDGSELPCDYLVAATGLRPVPPLSVLPTLQSLDDPAIFASGDCAEFIPHPLPKHGVFGVREAPVLADNLIAFARGETLREYRPQRRFLSILDLGNGEGFATWGGLAHRSRAALRLKRRLDFGFVDRFRFAR